MIVPTFLFRSSGRNRITAPSSSVVVTESSSGIFRTLSSASEPATKQDVINAIFDIRVKNNVPWKRLMEIALKHAPEETREVLREINANDRAISDLLGELAK